MSLLLLLLEPQLERNVESITMIYDVEGLGLKHLWKPAIETYGEVRAHTHTHIKRIKTNTLPLTLLVRYTLCRQILQMFEDNYPEGLKRLFVIKGDCIFVPHNIAHHPSMFFSLFILTYLTLFSCSTQTFPCGLQPRQTLLE